MNILDHPIWRNVTPYKSRISSLKRPLHLFLMSLSKIYAHFYSADMFVGVTGSVGKSATVSACFHVLSQMYKSLQTLPNLDPILNIPRTILRLNPTIKRVVLEMGIEYKGEMDFYLSLIKPKKVIVTRIYYAHSEFLGGIEEIAAEKGKLVENLSEDGVAILNWDDLFCRRIGSKTKAQVVYFGKDEKNCLIWAGNVRIKDFKTIFELNYGVERVEVRYNLLGEHQINSALAAACLGVLEGIPLVKIKRGLENVTALEHRLTPLLGPNGSIILDDTYNSSPAALEQALSTLLQIPARRRVVVLGEMRELGSFSEKLHREIAGYIYKEKFDLVILGMGEVQIIADELYKLGFLTERVESGLQNAQIVSRLLKILGKGDVCLIKGSRAVRLDEVVKRIAKKIP